MTTLDTSLGLAERLDVLEDREAIREVVANYCRGVDQKDEMLFLSIWEDDAKWTIGDPFGNIVGIEQIRETLRGVWGVLPESHHFTTNTTINVTGRTRASAISDVDCTATDQNGRAILIAATYLDDLRKTDGAWKFVERKVKIHYWTPVDQPWTLDRRLDVGI